MTAFRIIAPLLTISIRLLYSMISILILPISKLLHGGHLIRVYLGSDHCGAARTRYVWHVSILDICVVPKVSIVSWGDLKVHVLDCLVSGM